MPKLRLLWDLKNIKVLHGRNNMIVNVAQREHMLENLLLTHLFILVRIKLLM